MGMSVGIRASRDIRVTRAIRIIMLIRRIWIVRLLRVKRELRFTFVRKPSMCFAVSEASITPCN